MKKYIVALFVAALMLGGAESVLNLGPDYADAKGGSRSSSSGSRSSRPSVRPSAPKAPAPAPKPSVRPSAPKSDPPAAKPSVRPGSASPAPPSNNNSSASASNNNSSKPQNKAFDTAAASDKRRDESRAAYKPAAAPKPTYTTPTGKTVDVASNPNTSKIRSMPPEKYTNRSVRVEHHYHTVYGPRYDYYRSQPYIDVGGGFSPLFWYAMMDWSADRRAQMLYNQQNTINQQLLQAELAKNAELRAKYEALKASGVKPDPNYVDPEFKDEPDVMYDDNFVEAAYNPTPVPVATSSSSHRGWGGWCCLISCLVLVGGVVVYLVFFKQWNKDRYE